MRRFLLISLLLMLCGIGVIVAQDDTAQDGGDGLRVVEVLPDPDAMQISGDALVTVIFNRPVVPLGMVAAMPDLPQPLRFSPEISGRGEWLNTAVYIFRPEAAWNASTTYTITVEAGLQSVDGAILEAPFTWQFTTAAPALVSVNPQDMRGDVLLDQRIQARFNMPIDQASLEENFYMRPLGSIIGTVTGTFEWSDESTGFAFQPDDLLQLDTAYEIGYPAGVVFDASRSATLPAEQWVVSTVPNPAIVGSSPRAGEGNVYPYGGIRLFFASPMDQETLADKITIEPAPWREPDYFFMDFDNSLQISYPMEPSTSYVITVAPGMADIYGNTIDRAMSFSFATQALDPMVNLQVPGPVGFYNAYREETNVFVTHRNVQGLNLRLYEVWLPDFARVAAGEQYYDPTFGFYPRPDDLIDQWQIESVAPLNATRYELLDLGRAGRVDEAAAASCLGALPTRLSVGDSAIVITDPDPVRARSVPPNGEILDLLYRGYTLNIVGGPVCANDLLWWEVELRDRRRAWVAESVEDEYLLDLRIPGQITPVPVPIPAQAADAGGLGAGLTPGIYYLEVNSIQEFDSGFPALHFLVVGTANLLMKSTLDEVIVWATDVESGQPIADAPITLYDASVGPLTQAMTDADGIARIQSPRIEDLYRQRMVLLDDGQHFGVGLANWSDGLDPWYFGMATDFYPRSHAVYVYTDRTVYRPDQPVYFRGVVRAKDDVTYTQPQFNEVRVNIFDDRNEMIYSRDLPLTEFGTFSDSFELAGDAALGFYRAEAVLPVPEQGFSDNRGFVYFSVAEYRLPEFEVNLDAPAQVSQGEGIPVELEARYFFGGLVRDAEVEYNVVAMPYNFRYRGDSYDFSDFDPDGGPGEFYGFSGGRIASGTGRTDENGILRFDVPADLKDATQSQTFTIEAVVRDASGQSVAGRVEVIVHQGRLYVGGRPRSYVANAGQETSLEVIAVDWDSQAIAGQNIAIEIVERRWFSVQERDPGGRTIWTWDVEEIPVESATVTTGADGRAEYAFTPPNGGIFKATLSTRDADANEVRAATTLWVSSSQYVSWRQQNSNRIDLIADANDYAVGDTSEILITSPFQGTTEALITVERGDVLYVDKITMENNSFVYELPIQAAYAPNIYVSVVLVKGVDANNPVAAFRMGMIQLGVDAGQKEISIDITPDREQAGPRETVTYTLRMTDYQGNPVRAEVGVGLTDLASLAIGEPNSVPLMSFFYGQQGVSVRTSTALTINTDQITQTVIDTIKGGGGGFGEGGIFDIREEFVDTAYWNGALVTNADGVATFEVTLPDNLTRWRLDARAVTRGDDGLTLVGQETFDLQSTKPLLIRPVTPRFFVVGDEVTLAAIVNNNTASDQRVQVVLEAEGVRFEGEASQMMDVPAGAGVRVEWPVTVQNAEHVDLTFAAFNAQYNDASKPPLGRGEGRLLPIYNYEAPEIVGTGGVLSTEGSITESIQLPQDVEMTQGELTVQLQPSLAATTLDALDYLRLYDAYNMEATVSTLRPNVATWRALQRLNQPDDALRDSLNLQVQLAIQRLNARQKVDGGWGWTARDNSDVMMTAYALLGLTEAQQAGFIVDPALIERAQGFLITQYVTLSLASEDWRVNRQAFVLYVMARSGQPDVARTVNLFDNRDRLSIEAKALLAQTLASSGSHEDRVNTLISDITSRAILSANGTHWEEAQRDFWNWGSDTRTTAIVLNMLIQQRPESAQLPNIVRWLMVARSADVWETTQETAWALMALTDWMLTQDELSANYAYDVTFNDVALVAGQATPQTLRQTETLVIEVAQMLGDANNRLNIRRDAGAGNLYYTAYLRAFLPVPEVNPLNRGIVIQRRYTLLDDPERTSIEAASIGQLVQVRLTIIAPNDLYYVVIEDPIPAGTDAVNPNLATEQQIGTRPGLDTSDPLQYGWGWWWFSDIDFRDEKVVLSARYLPAGTYEYVYTIRPGLPGIYNVIPPTAREFYFPDVFGRGAGAVFTVRPMGE